VAAATKDMAYLMPMLQRADVFVCGAMAAIRRLRRQRVKADLKNIDITDIRGIQQAISPSVDITGVRTRYENIRKQTARPGDMLNVWIATITTMPQKTTKLPVSRVTIRIAVQNRFEYELCFKCHSFSTNLPADQRNKADQFNISNPCIIGVIWAKATTYPVSHFPTTSALSNARTAK
jgi:hypothetical protein